MAEDQKKAVVLAAGFGTRLRPLTKSIPKPLLPFCGVDLLSIILWQLNKLGYKDIAINGHYLAEKIKAVVEKNPWQQKLYFSHEKDQVLGSAGVYSHLKDWRQNQELLAYNGDILSDFPIKKLLSVHQQKKPFATLALLQRPLEGKRAIWLKEGRVIAISEEDPHVRGATAHGFCGIQMISDKLVSMIPKNQTCEIIPIYQDLIAQGEMVCGVVEKCLWYDLGTPSDYFSAHKDWILRSNDLPSKHDSFEIKTIHKKLNRPFQLIAKGETFRLGEINLHGPALLSGNLESDHPVTISDFSFVFGDHHFERPMTIKHSLILPHATLDKPILDYLIRCEDQSVALS